MRPALLVALLALTAMALSGCASKGGGGGDSDEPSATSSGSQTTTDTSTASTSATASGTPSPKPNAAPSITSFTANATSLGANVSFDASDADGDALSYTLSFGDGSANVTGSLAAGGGNATHTYAAAGNYTLTLEVRDAAHAVNQTLLLAVVAGAAGGAAQHESGDFTAVNACEGFFLSDLDGVAQLAFDVDAATYGLPAVASVDGDGIAGIRIGFFDADGANVGGADFEPGVSAFEGTVPDGAVSATVVGCGAGPYTATYDAGQVASGEAPPA